MKRTRLTPKMTERLSRALPFDLWECLRCGESKPMRTENSHA